MTSTDELRSLVEKYRPLAESGLSAIDFHRRVREDGVPAFSAVVLLRDLFGLNLVECNSIHDNYAEE